MTLSAYVVGHSAKTFNQICQLTALFNTSHAPVMMYTTETLHYNRRSAGSIPDQLKKILH
jgi:hypothetical protein